MVALRGLLADVELVFFETPGNAEAELRWMGSAWVRLGVRELARNSDQRKKVATDCVHHACTYVYLGPPVLALYMNPDAS